MAGRGEEVTIGGEGPTLAAYVVRPDRSGDRPPGVVLVHGFPSPQRPEAPSRTYHDLSERICSELGWASLAVSLRGCGASQGQFSLLGWVADVGRAVDLLAYEGCRAIWLIGSTTGGSIALLAACDDNRVRGVATVAARADFDDWAREPNRIIEHSRRVRAITDPHFPPSVKDWSAELAENRPVVAASRLTDRALLVLHGEADLQVPPSDARAISMAHGSAELRIISGGDHRLRHDPRALAILLGWLDRQTSADPAASRGSIDA